MASVKLPKMVMENEEEVLGENKGLAAKKCRVDDSSSEMCWFLGHLYLAIFHY